jgi:5'-methylthioadenosine phosphorylase
VENLHRNVATAKDVLARVVPSLAATRTCACAGSLQNAVITDPGAFPHAARRRLDLLIGKYFPAKRQGRSGRAPRRSRRG